MSNTLTCMGRSNKFLELVNSGCKFKLTNVSPAPVASMSNSIGEVFYLCFTMNSLSLVGYKADEVYRAVHFCGIHNDIHTFTTSPIRSITYDSHDNETEIHISTCHRMYTFIGNFSVEEEPVTDDVYGIAAVVNIAHV